MNTSRRSLRLLVHFSFAHPFIFPFQDHIAQRSSDMRKTFVKFDTDSDGKLSRKEFKLVRWGEGSGCVVAGLLSHFYHGFVGKARLTDICPFVSHRCWKAWACTCRTISTESSAPGEYDGSPKSPDSYRQSSEVTSAYTRNHARLFLTDTRGYTISFEITRLLRLTPKIASLLLRAARGHTISFDSSPKSDDYLDLHPKSRRYVRRTPQATRILPTVARAKPRPFAVSITNCFCFPFCRLGFHKGKLSYLDFLDNFQDRRSFDVGGEKAPDYPAARYVARAQPDLSSA